MRCGGREQSILELLQEIKENLLLENRAGQKFKEIKGKHSGSRNLPLEEKTELQMSDVNLAATIRANSGYFRTGRENIDSLEIRLKRYRRKQQMSILSSALGEYQQSMQVFQAQAAQQGQVTMQSVDSCIQCVELYMQYR